MITGHITTQEPLSAEKRPMVEKGEMNMRKHILLFGGLDSSVAAITIDC